MRGPDDDAARERRPRGVAAVLPPPARARRGARPARAVDGHVAGLPRRRRGGRDVRPRRLRRSTGSRISAARWRSETSGTARSSTSASPRRTSGTTTTRRPRSSSGATRSAVRTCAGSRRASASATPTTGPSPPRSEEEPRPARLRRVDTPAPAPAPRPASVHLVIPRSFNDAQQIADKYKESIPVILNLQGSDAELSKRLIDFASGLTYALEGGMQRVADKVFLPHAAQRPGQRRRTRRASSSAAASSTRPEPAAHGKRRTPSRAPKRLTLPMGDLHRRAIDVSMLLADTVSTRRELRRRLHRRLHPLDPRVHHPVAGSGCRTRSGSTGSSASSTTSATRISACSGASCRRSGRSTSRR